MGGSGSAQQKLWCLQLIDYQVQRMFTRLSCFVNSRIALRDTISPCQSSNVGQGVNPGHPLDRLEDCQRHKFVARFQLFVQQSAMIVSHPECICALEFGQLVSQQRSKRFLRNFRLI